MSKEEITSLKEEFLKEIRNLEKRLNLQLSLNLKETIEKNDKFIHEFNKISKNNKILSDLISSKNFESTKINELEAFKKKTETMVISHDVRINQALKELSDIRFTLSKEISENLIIPGFVGPACKYKTMANYISINIPEMEKAKSEIESNKKESKELKRKMEEMMKTLLNLVDKSSEKSLEYINNKIKKQEEITNNKFVEINDKILGFKMVLLTQDKIEDFKKKLFEEINDNNYNKKEIDNTIKYLMKNVQTNLDNLKDEIIREINSIIKSRIEKYEYQNKEFKKIFIEMNKKILKSNKIQSKLFKEFLTLKNNMNKVHNKKSLKKEDNDILDFNFKINKNLFSTPKVSLKAKGSLTKSVKIEEEKSGRNKTLDSESKVRCRSSKKMNVKNMKRIIEDKEYNNKAQKKYILTKENQNKLEENKIYNNNNIINKNKNDFNYYSQNEQLNEDSSIKIDKEKAQYLNDDNNDNKSEISIDNNIFNDINEENNDIFESMKEFKNILNIDEKKVKFKIKKDKIDGFKSSIIGNKKEKEKEINKDNIKEDKNDKEKEKEIITDNETINIKSNLNVEKENRKSLQNNKKLYFSKLIHYGMNNQNKVDIIPIEPKIEKKESNSIIPIFKETNSSIKTSINNNNTLKKVLKKEGDKLSLHKIAAIGVEEKIIDTFPSLHNSGKISNKSENLVKPFRNINSPLYQNNGSNFDRYITDAKNNYTNKKITSAFGRTSYSVYDKKDEGIRNLINKRIKSNDNRRYKRNADNFNLKLTPVARIKIYEK